MSNFRCLEVTTCNYVGHCRSIRIASFNILILDATDWQWEKLVNTNHDGATEKENLGL